VVAVIHVDVEIIVNIIHSELLRNTVITREWGKAHRMLSEGYQVINMPSSASWDVTSMMDLRESLGGRFLKSGREEYNAWGIFK